MENNFVAFASGFYGDGIFRFGKHKGKTFVEVATSDDADYFLWLLRESNPQYKTTYAHDKGWAKRNGFKLHKLLPKEVDRFQEAVFVKEARMKLSSDLAEFIERNLPRLKEEAKRCKDAYDANRYEELTRDW
jgi:hypothetical protein